MLLVLRSHRVSLTSVAVRIDQQFMHMVAAFKTLTKCTLNSCSTSSLSLEALRSLPSLTGLVLERSTFTHVEAAAVHLTMLKLYQSQAVCSHNCTCVTSLVQLQLSASVLERFHDKGVAACTRLKHINMMFSSVQAVDPAESFSAEYNDNTFAAPASLTTLKNLTSVTLSCSGDMDWQCNVNWLSCLETLQSLDVYHRWGVMSLDKGLSCLTALTSLCINVRNTTGSEFRTLFDWGGLISLVQLRLTGSIWLWGHGYPLSRLALLRKLRSVVVHCRHDSDGRMTVQLAVLAHELGRTRPDVTFEVDLQYPPAC